MSPEYLADVSHLHARKSNRETYKNFHALYGTAREGAAILLNRVVHLDKTNDHSMHLIVAQQRGSGGFMSRVNTSQHPAEYRVHYDPRETFLATTDGETISTFHTLSVQGLYRGHINRAYNTVHEHLHVSFMSQPGDEEGSVDFNLSSGRGSFSLGERAVGLVLGREESARLRREALTIESALQLDHPAVAS